MRILLAEDEEDLARVQIAMLKHSGYTVDHAANGREAILLAQKNAVAAVCGITLRSLLYSII